METARTSIASNGPRTWFCTFTWTPGQHSSAGHAAASLAKSKGSDFAVPPVEFAPRQPGEQRLLAWQYIWRVKVLNIEMTKFLKRLRQNSKSKFKYFLAWEMHTGKRSKLFPDVSPETSARSVKGQPHCHMLIHEVGGRPLLKAYFDGRPRMKTKRFYKNGKPIYTRAIQKAWRGGFIDVRLATPESERYVSKYVGKDLTHKTRLRTSVRYGRPIVIEHQKGVCEGVTQSHPLTM
jgi:hypothetical protein